MAKPDPTIRKIITAPQSLWDAVAEFRHGNRISSEVEAVRELVRRGLAAEATKTGDGS